MMKKIAVCAEKNNPGPAKLSGKAIMTAGACLTN